VIRVRKLSAGIQQDPPEKMSTPLTKDEFAVATDLYYVNISKT